MVCANGKVTYLQRTFHSEHIQRVCPQCGIVGVPGGATAERMPCRKPCKWFSGSWVTYLHLWERLWVSTCIDRAGMLTYIFPQTVHFFALFESSVL